MAWQEGKRALLLAALTTATAAGTEGSVQHIWSHPSGTESWIGGAVALGNGGSQVYGEFTGINGFSRLFSAFDGPSPTPIWQFNQPMLTTATSIASSERGDLHAVLVYQSTSTPSKTPSIYVNRSSSSVPVWTYDFPLAVTTEPSALHMSVDGSTVIAWVFDQLANRTRVASFHGSTGALRWTGLVQTYGPPVGSVLSRDGTRLALMGNIASVVLDAQSGTETGLLSNGSSVAPTGHAVSQAGINLVKARFDRHVEVWNRTASGYEFARTFDLGAGVLPTASVLSNDGSLLCVSGMTTGAGRTLKVRIFDLNSASSTPLFAEDLTGAGAFQVWTTGMCLSDRADVLSLATTGDAAALVPEILVYKRSAATGAWTRVFSHDLPGSAMDMDLSADGKKLVVGSKAIHAMALGGGGQIDLFRLADADLTLQGVPRAGSMANFTMKTTPNSPCALIVSTELAPANPAATGPYLQLGRTRTRILAAGTSNAAGEFTRTLPLTAANFAMLDDPATSVNEAVQALQVGGTFYVQGVRLTPRRFTEDAITVTILPQQ